MARTSLLCFFLHSHHYCDNKDNWQAKRYYEKYRQYRTAPLNHNIDLFTYEFGPFNCEIDTLNKPGGKSVDDQSYPGLIELLLDNWFGVDHSHFCSSTHVSIWAIIL